MARLAKAPIGQQIARIDAKCRIDRGTPVTFTLTDKPMAALPAIRWHLHCWQTACILLGARSNITDQEAFCPRDQKNQML